MHRLTLMGALLWLMPACGDDGGSESDATSASATATTTSTDTSSSSGTPTTESSSEGSSSATSETTTTSSETGSGTSTDTGTGTGSSDGGSTGGIIENCNDLIAAFQAETMAIRSCEQDNECGQVLTGTSCGCTRDWVARIDADTTYFYQLIALAQEMQCDLGLISTCDCPAANGFACVQSICNWNYE